MIDSDKVTDMFRSWFAFFLICLLFVQAGCQSTRLRWVGLNNNSPGTREKAVAYQPTKDEILQRAKSRWEKQYAATTAVPPLRRKANPQAALQPAGQAPATGGSVQTVSHEPQPERGESGDATLTIDGKTYRVKLSPVNTDSHAVQTAAGEKPALLPLPEGEVESSDPMLAELGEVVSQEPPQYPLDLPTALGMVGGQHPVVGLARWRVQEAHAQLDRAQVLWLPSLRAGFNYYRHDGNLQASDGQIIDANRNSFQYGLGAGAIGAGITQRPGVVAQFHVADALFQPEIARKNAWAKGHAASAAQNKQMLDAALAYIDLLAAEQDRRILEESRDRTQDLAKLTGDFAATGQGLQADADRLSTELVLVTGRLAESTEQADIASARLAQALSINPGQRIVPVDPTVVPIELVPPEYHMGTLISTGLRNRPELKEAQNLVSAACDEYKRQKYAPLIPSVLLGFSSGSFGGGLGSNPSGFGSRYDLNALMLWEVRNLGFGEKAARRETQARIEQAKFEKIRLLDRVAAQITEAHAQVVHRRERIEITRRGIQSALDSYNRNLSRIRDGQGLPIEVLQSVKALEEARRAYLKAVVEYNEAQFQLQWALGWQVVAPANSAQPQ